MLNKLKQGMNLFEFLNPESVFIYKLTHIKSGKIYIGRTVDLKQRMYNHAALYKLGFKKRDPKNWVIMILKHIKLNKNVSKYELLRQAQLLETKYILNSINKLGKNKVLNTVIKGYNRES